MHIGRSLNFETDDAIINSLTQRARHVMQMLVLSIGASLGLRHSLNSDSSLGRLKATNSRESSRNTNTTSYIYTDSKRDTTSCYKPSITSATSTTRSSVVVGIKAFAKNEIFGMDCHGTHSTITSNKRNCSSI